MGRMIWTTICLLITCLPAAGQSFVVTERHQVFIVTNRVTETPAIDSIHRRTKMYVTYADFHCPPCERLKIAIESGEFPDIEFKQAPAWQGIRGYPSVRFQDATGQWKSVSGYDANVKRFLNSISTRAANSAKTVSTLRNPSLYGRTGTSDDALAALHGRDHGW
jgi:hypothetical protein